MAVSEECKQIGYKLFYSYESVDVVQNLASEGMWDVANVLLLDLQKRYKAVPLTSEESKELDKHIADTQQYISRQNLFGVIEIMDKLEGKLKGLILEKVVTCECGKSK